mmetsp:Transcript_72964/g.89487  ORF Transcript_72964/g.89487 Transcript_72964/m.89487 type:complete len:261 (+) Transcript_72964:65-847(+)
MAVCRFAPDAQKSVHRASREFHGCRNHPRWPVDGKMQIHWQSEGPGRPIDGRRVSSRRLLGFLILMDHDGILHRKFVAREAVVEDAGLQGLGTTGITLCLHHRFAGELRLLLHLMAAVCECLLCSDHRLRNWSWEKVLRQRHRAAPAAFQDLILGVIRGVKVEVPTMTVLSIQLLRHFDDCINMLRPAVHDQLNVSHHENPKQLHWITRKNTIDVFLPLHVLQAQVGPGKLRWHRGQNDFFVPQHCTIRGLNDDGVILDA